KTATSSDDVGHGPRASVGSRSGASRRDDRRCRAENVTSACSRDPGLRWGVRGRMIHIQSRSDLWEGMVMPSAATGLAFEPPGPGSWEQDPVHFPRPMTRYFQDMHPPAFRAGTSDFARFYGML